MVIRDDEEGAARRHVLRPGHLDATVEHTEEQPDEATSETVAGRRAPLRIVTHFPIVAPILAAGRPVHLAGRQEDVRIEALFDDALRVRVRANLAGFERRALPADGRRAAAVAVVLLGDTAGRACFLLTRRAAALRAHSRQWALPGGAVEPGERAERAALRELEEEVRLTLGEDSVLGVLDDYGTRSGFIITPVVVWGGPTAEPVANPAEVAGVYRVPLADLDEPDVARLVTIPESDRPVIQLSLLGTLIHAPTAAIVYQVGEVVLNGRATRVDHLEQPVWAWG